MLRTQPIRSSFFTGTLRLQSELIGLGSPEFTAAQCAFLADELARHGCLADSDTAVPADPRERFCELVAGAHAALLRQAGFYFPEVAELAPSPSPKDAGLALAIPKVPGGTELSIELLQRLARRCAQTALNGTPAVQWIDEVRAGIAKTPTPLLAAAHMIRAAFDLGMPLLEWYTTFLQVGYGANAVALRGSITQGTPSIGVHFAREKLKANALLARAGFPVANGGLVDTVERARAMAETFGYPVVVKPADLDGGTAVSSDIRTPAELTQAFQNARAVSPKVMIESHIEGTDYRLLLFGDELLVTLERTPGGVLGTGSDSVAKLVERENLRPERGDGPNALLYKLALDTEARLMLERQGLSPDAVPAKGQFVRLRRAANHALGGSVRLFEGMHPDNIDLARRAMHLLRLDIAGLDLILPDATRSWREAGGAICEVNAQPFIGEPVGRDFYKDILRQLVPNGGRIPLVLVIGALDAKTLDALAAPGLTIVDAGGARRDGRPLSVEGMPWPQACQAALYDRATTAALFVLDPTKPAPAHSPADRFSAAVVLDDLPDGAELLLRRADALYALSPVKRKGLNFQTFDRADLTGTLAALLAGTPIRQTATTAPARRETAPPARRKRR